MEIKHQNIVPRISPIGHLNPDGFSTFDDNDPYQFSNLRDEFKGRVFESEKQVLDAIRGPFCRVLASVYPHKTMFLKNSPRRPWPVSFPKGANGIICSFEVPKGQRQNWRSSGRSYDVNLLSSLIKESRYSHSGFISQNTAPIEHVQWDAVLDLVSFMWEVLDRNSDALVYFLEWLSTVVSPSSRDGNRNHLNRPRSAPCLVNKHDRKAEGMLVAFLMDHVIGQESCVQEDGVSRFNRKPSHVQEWLRHKRLCFIQHCSIDNVTVPPLLERLIIGQDRDVAPIKCEYIISSASSLVLEDNTSIYEIPTRPFPVKKEIATSLQGAAATRLGRDVYTVLCNFGSSFVRDKLVQSLVR